MILIALVGGCLRPQGCGKSTAAALLKDGEVEDVWGLGFKVQGSWFLV